MHVIIVGAGEVGRYLAQRLGAEGNDVVVVEQNEVIAAQIAGELDVQVVVGSATVPSTLEAARVDKADLLAGVTQNDEVNLIASLLAKEAGVAQTVARIQTEELRGPAGKALRDAMQTDLIIDPDADTADEIMELVHVSGADEVYRMSDGDLLVIGAVIAEGSTLAGSTLAEIGAIYEPDWRFLFGALTRNGETVIPRGDQRLEVGDHVRVLTSRSARQEILELLGAAHRTPKRVMILGGGAVGSRVAERLTDEGAEVVLIEQDLSRAKFLSEKLPYVTIVNGDIEDVDLLNEESITRMDLVIAATGDDAANVLACAFAATEQHTFTVAVLHRLALLPIVRQFGIDAALSPRTASANAVLRHVRGGTASVATFLESDIEVDEFLLEEGAPADGVRVADLHLPHSIVLGAVIRPGSPGAIVRGATTLHAGDNVVVFARPDSIPALLKAFSA
ncbi:Trk system potassium transporter TrkA [Ilumatobacter coccineus]|jgi:trk/ktr system potassium uptake protein|uniref:Trk system potassium uptake protein TrkA n=1 Tax=Ilumatobacter coccineus (strain NBRC 103263 / KCTC 29153 / YM16-304) TaxID=1313172 RepID=A0A6C7E018_ILUCY|nr:Trk system potassium transporter TrkA [Ilumatobacter coccineus]BAN00707.1 Trk system potassium uptake protein TrkA [Ilumatobacter coccineus YM16-304]